jgi:hypothetical protein
VSGSRTNQESKRIEVSRPNGEWLHTHTLGKLARLERDGAVRAWPVEQLLTQ